MYEEMTNSALKRLLGEGPATVSNACLALASLLFLRWLDFQEGEQEAIAAFDGTDYEPVLPAGLQWRSWYGMSAFDLAEIVTNKIPADIKKSRGSHNPLMGQARRVGKLLESSVWEVQSLARLAEWVSGQPFETPSDRRRLLGLFDDALATDTRRESGEYRTPDPIVRLIASLAAPVPGDRIYDPCFGSAGLLTAALDYLQGKEEKAAARGAIPDLGIYGVDFNLNAYVIGLTRLALAGLDVQNLELGNSLERTPPDNPQRDGYDVVIANPPWGSRVRDEIASHFPVRTSDTSGLFIQHALMQLRPGGRAVIVVPESVLFRGGPEQRLRMMLAKEHTVEAVVGLSEGAFRPYASIRAGILVVRRGGETKQIRMVDASAYFSQGKGQRALVLEPDATKNLVVDAFATGESPNAWNMTVESLAAIDWDFTPRRREVSSLTTTLTTLEKVARVLPLSECCSISAGHPIRSEQHTERLPEGLPVPFIRIRDIQRGEAAKVISWLTHDAAATIETEWKLKLGDVLLSKSGTIGKVGIVRNGAVGGVPANGLYVLRPNLDILDPHYLVAYLGSARCRAWLDERARGATIRHLSKGIIESLPVPLPSLRVQQQVVEERREHDLDALEYLTQLLTEGERDPVAEWVEATIDKLSQVLIDPLDLVPLERAVSHVQVLRNKAAHGAHAESPLVGWLLLFHEATSILRGISGVPKGPGLLSALQEVNRGLVQSKRSIRGTLPAENRARRLNDLLTSSIERAIAALTSDVRLILTADVATLKVAQMGACELQVRNESVLPLREVHITTAPDWGAGEFNYLAERGAAAVSLSGPTPKVVGTFTIIAEWSALTLDGSKFSGRQEIAFDVAEEVTSEERPKSALGGSPYVCGDPVRPDRNDVFFGREELVAQIRRQIVESGNVVLLEGNRRAGKSSILRHLEGKDAVPGWMGVYCSLQGAEGSRDRAGVPTAEVFREMANSIAKALQTLGGKTPLPNGVVLEPGQKLGIARACREGIGDGAPFSDFRDYAEVALDMLKEQGLGLLLMMDEFDKLQEGIDSGVTSPQVPENIRFLVQTYPTFSAILTGSRRLKRLREQYWSALFGLGTRFGVSSLSEEAARNLITEPVRDRLTYSGEAISRAFTLTAGQPYLLQCLCNRIFDMAAQLKTRSITLDLVDQAANVLVDDNEHFASLWDYAGSDRRRFILALCHREAGGPDTFRLGVIQERLLNYGIEVDDETLIADLDVLRELELVELREGPSGEGYTLTIPLMGAWISHQQDFAALQVKAQTETEDQNG